MTSLWSKIHHSHPSPPPPPPFSDSDGSGNSSAAIPLLPSDPFDSIFTPYLELSRNSNAHLSKIQSFLTSSFVAALSCLIFLALSHTSPSPPPLPPTLPFRTTPNADRSTPNHAPSRNPPTMPDLVFLNIDLAFLNLDLAFLDPVLAFLNTNLAFLFNPASLFLFGAGRRIQGVFRKGRERKRLDMGCVDRWCCGCLDGAERVVVLFGWGRRRAWGRERKEEEEACFIWKKCVV